MGAPRRRFISNIRSASTRSARSNGAARYPASLRRRVGWTQTAGAAQTIRDQVPSILSFLPQTLEWNLVLAAATVFSWCAGITVLPGLALLALGLVWALHYAW